MGNSSSSLDTNVVQESSLKMKQDRVDKVDYIFFYGSHFSIDNMSKKLGWDVNDKDSVRSMFEQFISPAKADKYEMCFTATNTNPLNGEATLKKMGEGKQAMGIVLDVRKLSDKMKTLDIPDNNKMEKSDIVKLLSSVNPVNHKKRIIRVTMDNSNEPVEAFARFGRASLVYKKPGREEIDSIFKMYEFRQSIGGVGDINSISPNACSSKSLGMPEFTMLMGGVTIASSVVMKMMS